MQAQMGSARQDGGAEHYPTAAADAGEARKRPLQIPLRLGLIGHNGHDLDLVLASGGPLEGGLLELGKRTETFRFKDVPSRPVPSLLRGFSAPVNLTIDHSEADLQFLMANDSDLYNRWQAAQEYATRVLGRRRDGAACRQDPGAAGSPSSPRSGSPLPTTTSTPVTGRNSCFCRAESDIARVLGRDVDPLAIHLARKEAAQGDRDLTTGGPARYLPALRGQRCLFAGGRIRQSPRLTQCRARLPDEPWPPRGHHPCRGAFPACATPPTS